MCSAASCARGPLRLKYARISGADPNAIAVQASAAEIAYTAMRVAQGEVAQAAALVPEDLSPAKRDPKLAAACFTYAVVHYAEQTIRRREPHARLYPVNRRTERWASLPASALRAEPRRGVRRKRWYCLARRLCKPLACPWCPPAHETNVAAMPCSAASLTAGAPGC